jgi:signal transduction histidine kinase
MLNGAIIDDRFHVTADYILDINNNYSTEFWLFTIDYCRVISGDKDFYGNFSHRRIPEVVIKLFRPLSNAMIFQILPQIVRKFSKADVRTVQVRPTSAIFQWYGRRQDDPHLNEIHLTVSSHAYKNILSSVPNVIHGQSPATVIERKSMLDGSDHYEWEFRWEREPHKYRRWLLLGGILASALLVLELWIGIPTPILVIMTILFPLLLGLNVDRFNKVEDDYNQKETLLQEQRDLAEEQYDQSQMAKAQLQSLNVELKHKVDEFTALYDISVAINATLELDELIERSLSAVTSHLHFDRAMVLLVDEKRKVMTHGHSVGGSSKLMALVQSFEFPLDDMDNYLVRLLYSEEAIYVAEIRQDAPAIDLHLASVLETQEHLGSPLISKGRRLGILSVDNYMSKRPITQEEVELMSVVAGQIAVAIDNALLYQEVESQKQTLEQRVEQRTRELAQATAEAQEARTIAEEASQTKSAFLSNVSHELRTPLTSVLGFAKVIKRSMGRHIIPNTRSDEPQVARSIDSVQESLQIIINEGERLTNLINDVLDLAKIEAGKVVWDDRPLQISGIIEQALAATTSLFKDKGLRLNNQVESDLPIVVGDHDKLIQVMINLLSNAVKFTDEGMITCTGQRTNGEVVVSVSDTGIGIEEADLPKVFEVFRQVGDTLTDKPKGTGLGLAICKEIIEHHGGRIWAESQPGHGSTFSFSLPIVEEETMELVGVDYPSRNPAALN